MLKVIVGNNEKTYEQLIHESNVYYSENQDAFLMNDDVYKALNKKYNFKQYKPNVDDDDGFDNYISVYDFKKYCERMFDGCTFEIPLKLQNTIEIELGEYWEDIAEPYTTEFDDIREKAFQNC